MEEKYVISPFTKIVYGVLAIAILGFAGWLLTMAGPLKPPMILIVPVLMAGVAVLLLISLVKRKLVISEHSITYTNVFSSKELAIPAVKGYRLSKKIIILEPLPDAGPRIEIRNYTDLGRSAVLAKWVRDHFADLDAMDLRREQQELLQDTALGSTEEERKRRLAWMKNIALGYNAIGFAAIYFAIGGGGQGVLFMLAYPLLGVGVMVYSKGMIKFFSNPKRSVYPFIAVGVCVSCFVLLIQSLQEYHLLNTARLWLPALLGAGVLFMLFYRSGLNRVAESVRTQVLVMSVVALIYGFGGTMDVNCAFDGSVPQMYTAAVVGHRVSRGKSTSYLLRLGPWGPSKEEEEVQVRSGFYHSTAVGDTVVVKFGEGLLDIPWFVVVQ